jgi:hypothetical protein
MAKFIERFNETSLQWGLIAILCLAVIYGFRAWRAYHALKSEALADFHYKNGEGMLPRGLGAEPYVRAYRRFHAPRSLALVACCLGTIAVLTVPALGFFYGITFVLWELGGKDKVFAPGLIVHSMLMFFLIISFWALIAYVFARLYHDRHPHSLDAEIKKELG